MLNCNTCSISFCNFSQRQAGVNTTKIAKVGRSGFESRLPTRKKEKVRGRTGPRTAAWFLKF